MPLKSSSTISDEFNSHIVQTLPALLIEFPHYCVIATKMALGYVVCCVNCRLYHQLTPFRLRAVPTAPPITVFQPVSAVWM